MSKSNLCFVIKCCITVASICLCFGGVALADTTWTGGGDGIYWSDPANWDNGLPEGDVTSWIVTPGAEATLSSVTAVTGDCYVSAVGTAPILNIQSNINFAHDAGGNAITRILYVGSVADNEGGVVNHSAGKIRARRFRVAHNSTGTGRTGTFNFTGGEIELHESLLVGGSSGEFGTFNMSGSGTLRLIDGPWSEAAYFSQFNGASAWNIEGGNLTIELFESSAPGNLTFCYTGGGSMDLGMTFDAAGCSTIYVNGDVQFDNGSAANNVNFNLSLASDFQAITGDRFTILDATGSFTGHGGFGNLSDGDTLTVDRYTFEADYLTTGGHNLIQLVVIDDPVLQFLGKIDLNLPEMAEVKSLYDAGEYVHALEAWRDLTLADLRAAPMGEFGWHSAQTLEYYLKFADVLIGDMTQADYIDYLESIDRTFCLDYWGLRGAPGTMGDADWLAVPTDDYSHARLAGYSAFTPMGVRYWHQENFDYVLKWFEITSDFARNCYDQIAPLPLSQKRADYPQLAWNTDAGSALSQAWRVENIFKQAALFSKSLPSGSKAADWMDSLEPRPDALPEGAYDAIPARQLADIAESLVENHSYALLDRYLTAGAVPNQRFSGLSSLLLTSRFFNEFSRVQSVITPQADAAMLDFIESMIYPDGGMLEPSLNYNIGDARRMEELLDVFEGETRSWIGLMDERVDSFWRMLWVLRGPTFSPPQIGNRGIDLATEVWTSTATRDGWIQSQLDDYPAKEAFGELLNAHYGGSGPAPVFTSIALPYSGFYVQRSGWTIDDKALFFMAGRPQRGHSMADRNAIQLCAYGRELLAAAGAPNYYFATSPTPADDYLSEQSTAKVNTIMVDDQHQNKGTVAQQAYADPIEARWHSSSSFDFVEGLHDLGYGSEMEVSHQRQIFHVRAAGLWILLDNLYSTDDDAHTYRQIWNFQPYKTDTGVDVYGFAESEVLVDAANKRIYTDDQDATNTPNVALYSFGQAVQFTKYYGSETPLYGWYARGIGDAIPAVDVHTTFTATGDSQLLTLIEPMQGVETRFASLSEFSAPEVRGFDAAMDADGIWIKFRSTLSTSTMLSAEGVSVMAEALLTVIENGSVHGFVLGADSFTMGDYHISDLAGRSFEFEVIDENTVLATDLLMPESFAWSEADGIEPDYGYGSNAPYDLSSLDVIPPSAPSTPMLALQGTTVLIDWDENSESDISHYNIYRSQAPGGPYILLGATASSTYTDSSILENATYYYVVTAVDFSGNESSESVETSIPVIFPTNARHWGAF